MWTEDLHKAPELFGISQTVNNDLVAPLLSSFAAAEEQHPCIACNMLHIH